MSSSMYLSPAADIDALIALLAGVSLTGQYTVTSGPTATTEDDDTERNTKLTITMSPSSTYQGAKQFFYDRLDIGYLATITPYVLMLGVDIDIVAALPQIQAQYGVTFTSADLVDHSSVTAGANTTLLVEAESTSLGFVGSATLTFKGLPNISTVFNSTILAGF